MSFLAPQWIVQMLPELGWSSPAAPGERQTVVGGGQLRTTFRLCLGIPGVGPNPGGRCKKSALA